MNNKNIFLFQAVVLCVFLQIGQLMAKTEKKLPMRQSICLLRGSNGAGSGFFTNVNGKDCVITNNHVALELKDMKICNVQGKEYNFDKIYSSTHEDLAFIPIERDDHTLFPNLSIHPDPASLPDNAPVTVYGDSLGDGVIVALPGKLLGIGPKIIEVDSKFVPGNSGGPVMENKTQMVVGVATYCKIILQSSPAETGTRFEVNADRPSVRRFAIRIDKMLNDSFEELTQEQITHDQVQYQPIHEYHEKLMAFISSELGRKGLFWIFFNQEQIPALPREWKTVYLQKAAHEEMERIQNIYSLITHGTPQERKPQPLALEKEIKGLLQQYGSAIKSQKTASKKKRCFVCSGTGKFTQPAASRQNGKTSKQIPCQICDGSGKNIVRPSLTVITLPNQLELAICEKITPVDKTLLGFTTGAVFQPESDSFHGYYSAKNECEQEKFLVFTVKRYAGNHQMNEVKDTCLWFFGEKLVRADLFVPVKDLQQATATIDKLKAEFAGQNGPVLLCRYADPLELPKKKGPQKATDTIPFLPKLSEDELTVTFHVPYFQAPSPKKDPVKSRQNRQDQFVQQPANTLAELFQTRCTHITDLFGKYFYYGTGMARANEDIHPHALQYSPETGVLSLIRKTDPGYISVSVIHPAFSFLSGLGTEKEPDTIRFPSGNEPKNAPKSADAAPQWK